MLRNLQRRAPSTRLIAGTPFVGLLASQIIADTATGDYGPGMLYDEALANPGQRLRLVVTSPPAEGDLFVWEDGSVEFSGAPPAAYTIGYTPYVFNTALPGDTATINYGAVDASAAGATLTGDATLTPGAATGESNAAAPGADLTGTASMTPGAASGEQNATAPGATLTGDADLQAGTATGSGDGAASGATLTGAATLTPGAATGNQGATAPGATLTGAATLTPGVASGDQSATAPGADLTGDADLQPGFASGDSLPDPPARYTITARPRVREVIAAARSYQVTK